MDEDDLVEITMPNGFLIYRERAEIANWCYENFGYNQLPYLYNPYLETVYTYAIKVKRSDAAMFILRWC